MGKYSSVLKYASIGAIALIIIILLSKFIINSQIRSQLPVLPDTTSLSKPVIEQILQALETANQKPTAKNLGTLGMVYHSSANYEQAAQCYKLAIRRSRSDWIWDYYLGYLNMEMGNSEAVLENFKNVVKKDPDIYVAWYYIGQEYNNLGKNELAEEALSKITAIQNKVVVAKGSTRIDHFPLNIYALFQLSRIYFETGRYDSAEKTLKEILAADKSYGPAYRLLANIYNTKGDTLLSKKYSVRASDLFVFSPPVDTLVDKLVLLSRSELYLLKKIDEAQRSIYSEWTVTLVNHALQYLPENKYLISKAIEMFLWANLKNQAIALVDQHLDYFQDNFSEMKKTGMSFFLNGLYPQAMKYLTKASELNPEDIEIQKNLAISCWQVGDKQKSHEILNKLLEKNRNNPDVIADVANILFFNFKETDKAIGYLSLLRQLSPSNPKVQKLSAGIAEKNGQLREAIKMYDLSFRGNPEDLTTIQYLGNLLVKHEMWDKAIRHYREALKYHPNEPDFLEWLGTILIACPDSSLRNIEEGKEYAERAFLHISSRPNILVSAGRSLAYAYARLGDKQNAIFTIKQTISIARQENISRSYQAELENLLRTFQAMRN
jgi:tetratricopeptide (TPR) repeat protein